MWKHTDYRLMITDNNLKGNYARVSLPMNYMN